MAYPIVLPQHKTTSILPQIFLSEAVQLVPEQLSKQLHQQSEQQVDNWFSLAFCGGLWISDSWSDIEDDDDDDCRGTYFGGGWDTYSGGDFTLFTWDDSIFDMAC